MIENINFASVALLTRNFSIAHCIKSIYLHSSNGKQLQQHQRWQSCISNGNGTSTCSQSKIRTEEVVLYLSFSLYFCFFFYSIRNVRSVISACIRKSHMHWHDCDTNNTMKYFWLGKKGGIFVLNCKFEMCRIDWLPHEMYSFLILLVTVCQNMLYSCVCHSTTKG